MTSSHPAALCFEPIGELGDRPHLIVDGAPRRGTLRTLSHWPATPTPPELARDTSAEIVLAYLDHPEYWASGAQAVTCDHLDEDGALALYGVVDPAGARLAANRLVDAAHAGDFQVVRSPEGAEVAWALRHLFDPTRSVLAEALEPAARSGARWEALALRRSLEILPELLGAPERFRSWWEEEALAYQASVSLVETGAVLIEERRDLDLAVVRVQGSAAPSRFARIGRDVPLPLHPAAIHSVTRASRVLIGQERSYTYYDRYETWVRYVSRRLPLRRDLGELAQRLSQAERDGATWCADAPATLIPVLRLAKGAPSSLSVAQVTQLIGEHLEDRPGVWAPFRDEGAYVGSGRIEGSGLSGSGAPRAGTTGRGLARWRGRR